MADLEPDGIPTHIRALRLRAGFSMPVMARAMGFRGASSYQRYEQPPRKTYLPLNVVKLLAAKIVGRGNPPIELAEVLALSGKMSQAEPTEAAYEFSAEKVLDQFAAGGQIAAADVPMIARAFARAIPILLGLADPALRAGDSVDPKINEIATTFAALIVRQSGQDT